MLQQAIERYGERLHRAVLAEGDDHHVISPVGAWMLLATACPPQAADGAAAVLGMGVAEARAAVGRLMEQLPPSCRLAIGSWYAPRLASPELVDLAEAAPVGAATGPLPTREELDRWARDGTLGMFPGLPFQLNPFLTLLMMTLVATRARWRTPFETASAVSLGSGPFTTRVESSLWTPPGHDHRVAVVDTVAAGRVGVHQVTDELGLVVTSVVAESDIERLDVLAAAREVAAGGGTEIDIHELPLGHGPLWSVTEERVAVDEPVTAALPPHTWAHLPAWASETALDLLAEPALGLVDVANAVLELLPPHLRANAACEAGQHVKARYHARGFEAAALTYFAAAAGAAPPRQQYEAVRRHLSIRFGHPYAVAATDSIMPAWRGLPLFSGWVARPDEARDEAADRSERSAAAERRIGRRT